MIQRIQSVYLLLITAVMSIFSANAYLELITGQNDIIVFNPIAIQQVVSSEAGNALVNTVPFFILILFLAAISFINIFLYKKRNLQKKICLLMIMLLIGQLILMGIYCVTIRNDFPAATPSFKIFTIFPVICIILAVMASKAIHKDEMLVKSYDRIR